MTARANRFHGTSRFEILGQIGQGAMGFVYEVVDHERRARLALKTLRTPDPESILLLKNEFRAIQDLSHPNLVTPKELFEEDGQWFFTMDFVEGIDFLSYVRTIAPAPAASSVKVREGASTYAAAGSGEIGTLDEARLRSALRQVVVGLSALHADHKVHRDVKPSNVLVASDGRVQILDFGIVSDLANADANDDGELVGTVLYMAPEQAAGEAVTPAADWYALGAMLFQALTGRLPFTGNVDQILTQKMDQEAPAPRAFAPSVPADLNQLCIDLLRRDPAARPEGFEIMSRLAIATPSDARGGMRPARFIGRGEELRAIEDAFARAASGAAVTLLVEGESGVGKSWLVREFTSRVAARGALVFRGRCYERESLPYKAVDSLIDDLARYLASLPEAEAAALLPEQAGVLRTLFPVLERVPAIYDAPALDVKNPQEARTRMFALMRAIFVHIARRRRLVLAIDDLQWADADGLALLSEMLTPPDAPPLLLLASIRSSTHVARRGATVHDRLANLPGDVRWMHLESLPADDARALIRSLIDAGPGEDGASRDVDAIYAEAKGHPLFIDELVRHRATRTSLAPTRLDDALWGRATRLSPETRKLLELVAIAGVPLSHHIAGKAAALEFAQVFDAVGVLRAAHLVRTSGVYRHDTVEPYHDRVRESVLHHLDASTRKGWHARLALVFEQEGEGDPEKLLAHWLGAEEPARAAVYALQAADEAAAALAFDHAASLYRMAIELGKPTGDEADALRVKLAEALTNAGRGAEAGTVYLEAAGSGTSTRAIDMRRRAGEEFVCSGHFAAGTRATESALRAVGIRLPRSVAWMMASIVLYTIVLAVRGIKFEPRDEKECDPRDLLRLDCLASAACGLGMTDHVRGRMFHLRTLLATLRVGEPFRVGRAIAYHASVSASAGGPAFARTMELYRVVDAMAREQKQPVLEGMAQVVCGFAHYLSGHVADAREPFEKAEAIFRDRCVGLVYELASVRTLMYRTFLPAGDLPALARRTETTLREAEQKGDVYVAINMRCGLTSFLALARDDVDAAERELEIAASQLSKDGFHVQHAYWVLAHTHVALYRGDAAAVLADLKARWPVIERSFLLRVQTLRIPLFEARARAAIALASKSGGATLAEAEKNIRAIERERMPWGNALARMLRACVASVRGEPKEGVIAQLAAAEEALTSCGFVLPAMVARRQRGLLIGGDDGSALAAASEQWLTARGILNPARMSRFYAPGL
jgi:serine/threonine protein kinase